MLLGIVAFKPAVFLPMVFQYMDSAEKFYLCS